MRGLVQKTFFSPALATIGARREDRVKSLLLSKPSLDSLTAAETRVLKLIAEDRTSKEIAELLKISTKTVRNHRHNICRKLNIYGSHSLLKFAFDHKSYLVGAAAIRGTHVRSGMGVSTHCAMTAKLPSLSTELIPPDLIKPKLTKNHKIHTPPLLPSNGSTQHQKIPPMKTLL